jgi:hypothetical protein
VQLGGIELKIRYLVGTGYDLYLDAGIDCWLPAGLSRYIPERMENHIVDDEIEGIIKQVAVHAMSNNTIDKIFIDLY